MMHSGAQGSIERSASVKRLGPTPEWMDEAWQVMEADVRWTITLQSADLAGG